MFPHRFARFFTILATALVAVAIAQPQPAASAGTIAGFVNNAGTGDRLQSARIEVQPLGIVAVTDFEGKFVLYDLPPGEYQVSANYTGLDSQTRSVTVMAGQRLEVTFDLFADVYTLGTLVVSSAREGNAASISRQRTAKNVKNVIALDAFGNVPNDSIGEVLIRLPGIAGRTEDSGEVTGAVIRGAAVGLNTVSIDGNLQSSIGGMGREFRTNTLSGALFEEIEVIKGVTPDMPSDSLGGAVNMKTRSALSLKEKRRFNYRAAVRFAPSFYPTTPMRTEHRQHPQTSFGYQEIFDAFGGKRNLAISINTFYSENVYSNGQVIQDYQYTTGSPAYVWDYRTADSYNMRKQASSNLRIDYKLSENTQFFISGIYNDAFEPFQRLFTSRAYTGRNATSIPAGYTDTLTRVNPVSGSIVQLNSTMYSFLARERQINVGAKHDYRRWKIDYDAYYNHSNANLGHGKRDGVPGGGIFTMDVRNVGWTLDKGQSGDYPVFTQTAGASIYDAASYSRGSILIRDSERNTGVYGAKGNVSYLLPWQTPTTLKTGFFYRNQKAEEVANESTYDYVGTGSLAAFVEPTLQTSDSQRSGKRLPFIDSTLVVKDIAANPGNWRRDLYGDTYANLTGTRDVNEDVTATFLQAQSQFGKLSVLGGVRYEKTKVESHGNVPSVPLTTTAQRTADPVGSALLDANNPRTTTGSYADYFPSIHLTYNIKKNLQARLSWSNSVGRPAFTNLLPTETISDANQTVTVNNPALKPQYAENWDASLEYYFEPAGVISIGYFRKDITDFIVTGQIGVVESGSDNGFGGRYGGYALRSSMNGGMAKVKGWEFNYNQQLTMLPGVFKGLGVFANYTYLTTDGDYGLTEPRSTSDVAGFYPETGNAGLTFKYKKLGVSATVNYTGEYLASYSADASRLRYRFDRTMVNFGATYDLRRGLSFFADLQNAFNEPNAFYRYRESQVERITTAGTTIVLGVSGRF